MRKQVVASASLEERLAGLAPEERLAGLAPEERLAGLTPEEVEQLLAQNATLRKEVVDHTPPEERLLGLGPAELRTLMKQIERYLQEQSASKEPPAE